MVVVVVAGAVPLGNGSREETPAATRATHRRYLCRRRSWGASTRGNTRGSGCCTLTRTNHDALLPERAEKRGSIGRV